MATKFGRLDYSNNHFVEQTFHKSQTLTEASEGTHYFQLREDDYRPETVSVGGGLLSTEGLHWAFIHGTFYLSGSSKVNPDERDKFNSIYHKFNQSNDLKPFWTHKFYSIGSVFYIPQQTFGERIQPGSFQLTARTGSSVETEKQIKIRDDGNGNLYSINAHHSQSAGPLSSKENYLGNIFYDLGVVTVTETGSWSGSVNYSDIGQVGLPDPRNYKYWELKFNSTTPIFTSQYSLTIPKGEFNFPMNYSARGEPSGSDISKLGNLRKDLFYKDATGIRSNKGEIQTEWAPYFNQIQLFRSRGEEPLLIANLPRSVQVRKNVDIIIQFRIDH